VTAPLILWLRQDLRLTDHPALTAAAQTGRPIVPLYILDDETPGRWRLGGAQRWWLHHSLAALAGRIAECRGTLVLRQGQATTLLPQLIEETGAEAVYWSRRYEPFAIAADKALKARLEQAGIEAKSFNAALVHEPWTIEQAAGGPYKVYTPYAKAWLAKVRAVPLPIPEPLAFAAPGPATEELASWRLLPTRPDWAGGLRATWQPGEAGAAARLADFLDGPLDHYGQERSRPDHEGVSRLSPHLHFGEIGPRQIVQAAEAQALRLHGSPARAFAFIRQLIWREFAHHTLYHFPASAAQPLRPSFERFPWSRSRDDLMTWAHGRTGFPMVDAGMRQLWQTGWMHKRVSMLVASFLTKDLLIPWQDGADWFWDTLVDADLANNSMGWQWTAGSGVDAAPYFRIFNPTTQGRKFDPRGAYIRQWLPELANLPPEHIHDPAAAPPEILAKAGITLGRTYPHPMLDHAQARVRALEAYRSIGD
jgi:deoxyribodipyrimidine photo-lyase